MRHHPSALGRCKRWFKTRDRTCNRSARYTIHNGAQEVCKECYRAHMAGRLLLFDPGPGFTAGEIWDYRQRLDADVEAR